LLFSRICVTYYTWINFLDTHPLQGGNGYKEASTRFIQAFDKSLDYHDKQSGGLLKELKKSVEATRCSTNGSNNSLGLNEDYPWSISDWLTQARLFYTAALKSPEIQDKLKEFAVTAEKLQAGLALVDGVESLNSQQEVEKGEAQQATRDRDAAFAALDKFMYAFNKIARLLLTEKPEHLEKLGILERSAPLPKPKSPPTTPPQPE
jgi:hypothetical protein